MKYRGRKQTHIRKESGMHFKSCIFTGDQLSNCQAIAERNYLGDKKKKKNVLPLGIYNWMRKIMAKGE